MVSATGGSGSTTGSTGSSTTGSTGSTGSSTGTGIGNGVSNGQNGLFGLVGGSSTGGVTFSGLASGVNSSAIIQALMAVENQPVLALQAQQQQIQAKETAYSAVSAQLVTLQAAALPLDTLTAFDLVTATSSNPNVATVTAQTGAQTGTHTLTVNALAQAEIIGSAPQTSQTAPLNFSGGILINGKNIQVSSQDSLQTLASNINAAQAGVTASIISPNPGQYYLTFASSQSGTQGQISLSDVGTGSLLSQLGFTGGAASITHPLSGTGGGAGSDLFSDSATPVATLEGLSAATSGSVQMTIGGVTKSVTVDLSQSLSQIASSINTAFGSTVASVQSVNNPNTGTSAQQLQIAGATGFTDSNNVLASLGLYQQAPSSGKVLAAARNASFVLDGLAASSPTNTVTSAISGVSINLLQDASSSTTGTAPTTTFTVSPDTTTITKNIQSFVTQYNATVDMINQQSAYDSTTGNTGILFGDSNMESVLSSLAGFASSQVQGLPSNLSSLSQIGITLTQTGDLQVDNTALSAALTSNLQGVSQIFQQFGKPSNPNVAFVSSTYQTTVSPPNGYAIDVTSPATPASFTSSTIQTQPLASAEQLTFGGSLFGSSQVTAGSGSVLTGPSLLLPAGSTAAGIVSLINANSVIGAQVSASLDSQGHLVLTSKQYGSGASFQVTSAVPASSNSSGIGNSISTATGTDIQGTINGEQATGNGQFLTGSQLGGNGTANGMALGLQVRVAATQPGSYGTISYTSGVADQINNLVQSLTDPTTGVLTLAVQDFQNQYNTDQTNVNAMQQNLAQEQQTLQTEFTYMETTVSQLKAASAGLNALTGVTSSSSSSSSSTSSSSSSSTTPGG